jgi:hypothetical protein
VNRNGKCNCIREIGGLFGLRALVKRIFFSSFFFVVPCRAVPFRAVPCRAVLRGFVVSRVLVLSDCKLCEVLMKALVNS